MVRTREKEGGVDRLIRKTGAEQVADRIEVAILAGEFESGGRLPPETKLAADLGVGRSTLREGIQILVARGLLMRVPGIGTFVVSLPGSRSIETLPAIYLFEKIAARKVELLKQFLDYRRGVAAEVLALACTRCSSESMRWLEEALVRMSNFAEIDKDAERALEEELALLECAAERADARFAWLTMQMMRRFFRIAKKELVSVAPLEELRARAQKLKSLLENRDAAGIREYVATQLEKEDYRWIRALEQRIREQPAEVREAPPANALPPQSPTGSSTPPPTQSSTGTLTRMVVTAAPAEELAQPAPDAETTEPASEPLPKDGWTADPEKYPRTDPRAWHPYFVDWCRRNLNCNPWDDPEYVPPGSPSPYEEYEKYERAAEDATRRRQ